MGSTAEARDLRTLAACGREGRLDPPSLDPEVVAGKLDAQVPSTTALDTDLQRVKVEQDKASSTKLSLCSLFTISMFGSLDDFAVQVSLMLSGVLSAPQLSGGVLLGSLIVLMVCMGAGTLKCVVRVLERIPLWSIIGAFAIWTY